VPEGFPEFVKRPGFPENIEVLEEHLPITNNVEDPATHAAVPRRAWAKVKLGKMQDQRVSIARIHRNRIREVSVPSLEKRSGSGESTSGRV